MVPPPRRGARPWRGGAPVILITSSARSAGRSPLVLNFSYSSWKRRHCLVHGARRAAALAAALKVRGSTETGCFTGNCPDAYPASIPRRCQHWCRATLSGRRQTRWLAPGGVGLGADTRACRQSVFASPGPRGPALRRGGLQQQYSILATPFCMAAAPKRGRGSVYQ